MEVSSFEKKKFDVSITDVDVDSGVSLAPLAAASPPTGSIVENADEKAVADYKAAQEESQRQMEADYAEQGQ